MKVLEGIDSVVSIVTCSSSVVVAAVGVFEFELPCSGSVKVAVSIFDEFSFDVAGVVPSFLLAIVVVSGVFNVRPVVFRCSTVDSVMIKVEFCSPCLNVDCVSGSVVFRSLLTSVVSIPLSLVVFFVVFLSF